MQKDSQELASKKRQAVHLFIVKGYTKKEISKIIGVSEHTIWAWSKKYKWNDKETKDINSAGGVSVFIQRFILYIESIKPESVDEVKLLWDGFLKLEGKSF